MRSLNPHELIYTDIIVAWSLILNRKDVTEQHQPRRFYFSLGHTKSFINVYFYSFYVQIYGSLLFFTPLLQQLYLTNIVDSVDDHEKDEISVRNCWKRWLKENDMDLNMVDMVRNVFIYFFLPKCTIFLCEKPFLLPFANCRFLCQLPWTNISSLLSSTSRRKKFNTLTIGSMMMEIITLMLPKQW